MFSTRLENFLPFSSNSKLSSANSFSLEEFENCHWGKGYLWLKTFTMTRIGIMNYGSAVSLLTITRRQILDLSKLKDFANDNLKFEENGRKLFKPVENTVGNGEIARYEQFLLFPQCFQKACFPWASKGVIVWEWVNPFSHKPDF